VIVESTASLLSLVKTFNSMLSVYEGFCNLKQVSLSNHIAISTFYVWMPSQTAIRV
jgi:hypothetical protein